MAELGEKNATNDHSTRDMKVELQRYSDLTFSQTRFRFLRIDFYDGADFKIKNIVAATDIDEREQQGKFECNANFSIKFGLRRRIRFDCV